MPQVEISVGGRVFEVACQPGEEQFLHSAAAMLDEQARPLAAQVGRIPESRMLLMAGLLLADHTASLRDEVARLKATIAEMEASPPAVVTETVEVRVEVPVPVEMRVEVPVERVVEVPVERLVEVERVVEHFPAEHLARLAELADDIEALADQAEDL